MPTNNHNELSFEIWELILDKIQNGDYNAEIPDWDDKEDDVDPKQC